MIKEKLTYKNKRAVKRILRKQWANGVVLGLILAITASSAYYFGYIASPAQQPAQYQADERTANDMGIVTPEPKQIDIDTIETEITKAVDGFSPLVFGEIIGTQQVVRIDFTAWNITSQSNVAGYDCRINEGPWQTCATPKIYDQQQTNKYVFEVRGVDQDGNVDTTPAAFMWSVK